MPKNVMSHPVHATHLLPAVWATPFFVGVRNKQTQLFDLALADYNKKVQTNDIINQSILLEARGRGERFKGELTARTEYMKAAGSLLTMGSKSSEAGRLVIT